MKMKKNNEHSPLFTVFKRSDMPKWKAILIRVGAVFGVFVLTLLMASAVVHDNPFNVLQTLFKGAFISPWVLIYDSCVLLGFGVAIVPAFKMKFWNMGANGQVLASCLAAILIMFYYGEKMENVPLILLMFVCAIVAGCVWAVVPALCKAFFNTNETLFTLMMNYIAVALVGYFNFVMAKGKKETPGIINQLSKKGWIVLKSLPIEMRNYIVLIIFVLIITVLVYIYIAKTKHGYEITVLGDSVKTAKYVGMNTKWITIRTLFVSGIICGCIGFLFAASVHHSVTVNLCGSLGFTGVLIAWLSNFNPLVMAGISFFLAFLTNGTSKISSMYRLGSNDLSSVMIGLIFFAILVSEFFIRYVLKINKDNNLVSKLFKKKENKENKDKEYKEVEVVADTEKLESEEVK